MDWSTFYAVSAGAAATLLGLLFVAIQINIGPLTADPASRWRALARATFYKYTFLLIFSVVMLFPASKPVGGVTGYAMLFIAAVGVYRLLATWLPVWRGVFRGRRERLVETVWWLVTPLAIYLALARLAVDLIFGGRSDVILQLIGYFVVGLFSIVLRNTWRLLVELTAERGKGSGAGR